MEFFGQVIAIKNIVPQNQTDIVCKYKFLQLLSLLPDIPPYNNILSEISRRGLAFFACDLQVTCDLYPGF